MKKEHKNDEVILLPDSVEEFKSTVKNLDKDHIPYKSFCQAMIVLTYSNWLLSNIHVDAK